MKDAYLIVCETIQSLAALVVIGLALLGGSAAIETIENAREISDGLRRRRIFSEDLQAQAECDCLKCRCCVACKGR